MLNYIKGMDISSLDEIEKLGAKFYDHGREDGLIKQSNLEESGWQT